MIALSEKVHPLVLGQVYRSRAQIKMLAEKLLQNQITDQAKIQQIISFLCSDSGSHDYTINRREAENGLGLNIIKPDMELYEVIKSVYDNFSEELGFRKFFDPRVVVNENNGEYEIKRGLIESISGGSDYFTTQGRISLVEINGQQGIQNEKLFEGWKHEN